MGLAIGGAYLAGGLARATVAQERIARIAAASDGLSDTGLSQTTAGDPSALAVARRHDPLAPADAATEAGRRNQAILDRLRTHGQTQRVTFKTAEFKVGDPARPFHIRGALDASRDLECLTQAVYYESRGEGAAGQAAVAQVILNRVRHPAFPKSICAVVFQGCQFSFACDGSVGRRVETAAWRRAERVASKALDGFVMAEVGNATHFHVSRLSPVWSARLMKVAQVGAHIFYRFGGRNGAGSAFKSEVQPSEAAPATNQPIYASLALSLPTQAPVDAGAAAKPAAPVEAKPVITPVVAAPATPAAQAKPSAAADEPAKAVSPQA